MASIATMHRAKQQAKPSSPIGAQIQCAIAGIAKSDGPVLIPEAERGLQASVAEGSHTGLIVSGRTPVDLEISYKALLYKRKQIETEKWPVTCNNSVSCKNGDGL